MQDLTGGASGRRTRRGGRPRDPNLEDRVFDTALDLYTDTGWSGFNFDVVARTAGVGKASIYSRWPKREDLLRDTFERRLKALGTVDEGSLRADLIAYGALLMSLWNTPRAGVMLHFAVDTRHHPEIREITAQMYRTAFDNELAMVDRAAARGELPEGFDGRTLVHAFKGGCLARATHEIELENGEIALMSEAEVTAFVRGLTDLVLNGVEGYRPAP
ncbi:MAG: TetR/AcrR family transcriptional regulator [Pseudomonadota bacterium]|nr:TetR/AcrR family transcriptional regulator [Pseudomonadota bacterium]